jgi:Protein phosphatase 2C
MTLRPVVRFGASAPKRGNLPGECEDAFQLSASTGHFAIADGASDASYSAEWARILVESFPDFLPPAFDSASFDTWLDDVCRPRWSLWEASLTAKPLPWFTKDKLLLGSHATFLGLAFDLTSPMPDALLWHAVACGDACLFIVQDERLRLAFPLQDSASFDNTPALVPTNSRKLAEHLRITSGSVSSADRIYLTTDALARWFLEADEQLQCPWRLLDAVDTDADLEKLLARCRDDGTIRNDDVALIRIEAAVISPNA